MTDPDEPARRLYDALRAAGMTPQAWGEWEKLATTSPAAMARLRHAAGLLWPEPEQEVVPVEEPAAEEPEPARLLYEAVQQHVEHYVLTWKGLGNEDKGQWRRAAACVCPEPVAEEPAVTEHRHMWDCAACRHDTIVLFCRHCPAIRQERL